MNKISIVIRLLIVALGLAPSLMVAAGFNSTSLCLDQSIVRQTDVEEPETETPSPTSPEEDEEEEPDC